MMSARCAYESYVAQAISIKPEDAATGAAAVTTGISVWTLRRTWNRCWSP